MKLAPFTTDAHVRVVVETPKNARVKLRYDARLGVFAYQRPVPVGVAYPYDWGFVPATLGEDGDPLDGMVVHDVATFPGTVVECRLLCALRVEQTQHGKTIRNDRYFFHPSSAQDGRALSARQRADLERFFAAVVAGTGKELRVIGWDDAREAMNSLRRGARAFAAGRQPRKRR